jgi:hypothetical protein
MSRIVMSLLGSALVGACSVVGIRSGSEQLPYHVIAQIGETVEVRRYPERLAAEAVVEAVDERAARNQAFGLLFAYISGANRSRAKIAMTVPVAVDQRSETIAMTSPVATAATPDGRYAMRFFLPASYTPATAPEPTEPRVRIVTLPEATVAALRFSGSTDPRHVQARQQELLQLLEGSAWRPVEAPVALFYDPPWTLPFLRRNEVAVAVEPR